MNLKLQKKSELLTQHLSLFRNSKFKHLTAGLLLGACGFFIAGCSGKKLDPYAPHETLLSITAEYQLLANSDPYTHRPTRDITGQQIGRATLVRLANYEGLYPDRFELEILVLKARAYEQLGDHELAEELYRQAVQEDSELQQDCLRRAQLNREIANLQRISEQQSQTIESMLQSLQKNETALWNYAEGQDDSQYAAFARRASEDLAVARGELLIGNRWILENGEQAALDALKNIMQQYSDSWRSTEHAYRLARFYRALAEEEVRLHPPTGIDFDEQRTMGYLNTSLDLLYRVSQADGEPEKLIASRELDTVLMLKNHVIDAAR